MDSKYILISPIYLLSLAITFIALDCEKFQLGVGTVEFAPYVILVEPPSLLLMTAWQNGIMRYVLFLAL